MKDIKFISDEERKALQVARIQSATIEAQRVRIAELESDLEKHRALMLTHLSVIDPLKADAERYRWWRNQQLDEAMENNVLMSAREIDEQWDKAMKEKA